MNRLSLISLLASGAMLLSACGAQQNLSWPGLAADAENAYLASGSFVYAVRLSDGAKAWQYPEKAGSQVFYSNPVLASDGQLLVGSAGSDNGMVSLDTATGRETWAAPLVADNHWVAPPLVVGDTIYASNNNGTLYAAELATGHILWSLPLNDSLWGAPTSNGKLVFVPSLDHRLYAVDPESRSVAWDVDLAGSIAGSTAVSPDGSTLYAGSFASKVFAVDTASGAVIWTADVKGWVWGAPVLAGDSVFVGDMDGHVYSLGAPHGKNAWPDIELGGPITGSPLALPDGMLVVTDAGTLFAFDRTGSQTWFSKLDIKDEKKIRVYTTPVASGDVILVAPMNADYLLRAVSLDGKFLPWEFTGK
jgi:outer membrane protein assembly factor BamB